MKQRKSILAFNEYTKQLFELWQNTAKPNVFANGIEEFETLKTDADLLAHRIETIQICWKQTETNGDVEGLLN